MEDKTIDICFANTGKCTLAIVKGLPGNKELTIQGYTLIGNFKSISEAQSAELVKEGKSPKTYKNYLANEEDEHSECVRAKHSLEFFIKAVLGIRNAELSNKSFGLLEFLSSSKPLIYKKI